MLKKAISILLVLSMMFTLCGIAPVYAETSGLVWSFDTDSDQEGWLANKGSLSVADGVMTHTINAGQSNAFLLSPKDLSFVGSENRYVKIRLKNNNCASTTCVVSFTTTNDTTWDTLYSTGTKSVMTAEGITGYDSDYTEYVIDMSVNENWMNGTITRFRLLTFLNTPSVTAGSMDIDYIEVTNSGADTEPEQTIIPTDEPETENTPVPTAEPGIMTDELSWGFSTNGDNEGWAANKGSISVANGVMTHTISAGHSNAFLLSPKDLNIVGSENRYVKIRLKNNNCASTTCVVSFITTDDTAWDTLYSTGTKSVMTAEGITGYDSDYTEYVIDMSECEKWINGTVTRFRLLTFLNTPNVTAGSMDIDYIEVSNSIETQQPTPEPTPEPTPTPVPTETPEPVVSRVEMSAYGTDAAMVGSYVVMSAKAEEEGLNKIELYEGDNLIYSVDTSVIADYPYELTRTGEYTFTAKAYYNDGEDISEKIQVTDVTDGRKERSYAGKYTFENDVEGFIARNTHSALSHADNAAVFEIKAENAYLYTSGISLDLSKGSYVIIKMKNTTADSKVILQWKTAEDNTFTEDKKITFSGADSNDTPITTKDSEYKEYVFYLGDVATWADKHLTYLQIYPAAGADSGVVYIDEIVFSDMQNEPPEIPEIAINSDCNATMLVDTEINLSAQVTNGKVEKVAFYNGTRKLGEAETEPYSFKYTPNSAENAQFYALATDECGAIIKSENAINVSVKNLYDISEPMIKETADGVEVSITAVQNADTREDMLMIAAIYDSQGNMLAIKSTEVDESNSGAVSFTKQQQDKAEKMLVTVIKSLTDAKCYTKAFVVDF